MPASTFAVTDAEGELWTETERGRLCGLGAVRGDCVGGRTKAAAGGGLMYERGEVVVAVSLEVRYEPSRDRSGRWYRDPGDVLAAGLAQSVGEGEVDIISISDNALFEGAAVARGRRR